MYRQQRHRSAPQAIPAWGHHDRRESGLVGVWLLLGIALTVLVVTLAMTGVLGQAGIKTAPAAELAPLEEGAAVVPEGPGAPPAPPLPNPLGVAAVPPPSPSPSPRPAQVVATVVSPEPVLEPDTDVSRGLAPPPAPSTALDGDPFAGSGVTISNSQPGLRSDVTVTLTLVRDGHPIDGADVYLVAHYRTTDERHPPGNGTARTDADGLATITFNIENATPGFEVQVDVTALIEGSPVAFQTSFTPR